MAEIEANPDKVNSPSAPSTANDGPSAARPRWAAPVLMAIGLAAGAAGSEVIYATRELFQVPAERLGMPPLPPEVEREILYKALASHAVGFGALGLLVCGSLGLGLGAIRGSAGVANRALLVGGVLGLLLGAGGGMGAVMVDNALAQTTWDVLFKAMLIHLPNWVLVGLAMAITVAVAVRNGPGVGPLVLSAIATGVLAAMLYGVLSLIVFPAAESARPIPFNLGVRILCFAVGGAVFGLYAARSVRSAPPSPNKSP